MQTYYVKVTTGTVWGAGTDANVFIVLYGDNDDTGTIEKHYFILVRKLTGLLHLHTGRPTVSCCV